MSSMNVSAEIPQGRLPDGDILFRSAIAKQIIDLVEVAGWAASLRVPQGLGEALKLSCQWSLGAARIDKRAPSNLVEVFELCDHCAL